MVQCALRRTTAPAVRPPALPSLTDLKTQKGPTVARARLGKPYDEDGKTAASGTVDEALLARLLQHDFFKRKPPKSAWRLDFGSEFAHRQMDDNADLPLEDFLAITEFTAVSIVKAVTEHVPILDEISVIIASGGGVRNKHLMSRIAANLSKSLRLAVSDEYGIPAQYKEAVKFAALALAAKLELANNIPAASGASRFAILGKLVAAPRLAKGASELVR